MLNNKPSQFIHQHRVLMKDFTPHGLHLLGLDSMAWASVLLNSAKIVFYMHQMLLKHTPMSSECQNLSKMTIRSLNLAFS